MSAIVPIAQKQANEAFAETLAGGDARATRVAVSRCANAASELGLRLQWVCAWQYCCPVTIMLMNEWNIQSRAHHCEACSKGFGDQQPYHTLLFEEKQEFKRLDICEPCWQAQYSQGARERKGFVSYWQGVYEAAPPPPPDPIQKETAESLLRKIIELNDPKYTAASYILAVMLERKRLFKIKEQFMRDGQRTFIYEHPRTGDLFTIPDPGLQLNQLDQVQHDVAALLEYGLIASAEPSAATWTDAPPTPAEASAVVPQAEAPAAVQAEAVNPVITH